MKKLMLLCLIGLLVFSCKKEKVNNQSELFVTDLGNNAFQVSGNFTEDYILTNDKEWYLSGGVFVKDGVTLTVEAGTVVYAADDNTTPFLSVLQGGKLVASGTEDNPIVFTSKLEQPGSWGGLVLNGYATINTGLTAEGEGGTGVYGGTDDHDNSGVLRYVRVEYAGKILGTDNELNRFSFNGVGDATLVEYVEAYRGADDGLEFFGGTVNVKYAVSVGNHDDSFDWTHGWRGKGQFWVAKQLSDGGDRGIEADNNGDDNAAEPYSNPTLSNVTLEGYDDGDGSNTGMRLREGTKGKLYNVEVYNFPKYGVRVSDSLTLLNKDNGELFVANSNVYNNGTDYKDCDFSQTTETLNDSWFEPSTQMGAGTDWTNNWTKGL